MKNKQIVILTLVVTLVAYLSWALHTSPSSDNELKEEAHQIVRALKKATKDGPMSSIYIGSNKSSLSAQGYGRDEESFYWDSKVSLLWFDKGSSSLKIYEVDFSESSGRPKRRRYSDASRLMESTRLKNEHISELSDKLSTDPQAQVVLSGVKEFQVRFEPPGSGIMLLELAIEKDGLILQNSFNLTQLMYPKTWKNRSLSAPESTP